MAGARQALMQREGRRLHGCRGRKAMRARSRAKLLPGHALAPEGRLEKLSTMHEKRRFPHNSCTHPCQPHRERRDHGLEPDECRKGDDASRERQ